MQPRCMSASPILQRNRIEASEADRRLEHAAPPWRREKAVNYKPANIQGARTKPVGAKLARDCGDPACINADCATVFTSKRCSHKIGRASCRERVCQYVEISVGAVSLKKKNKKENNTK